MTGKVCLKSPPRIIIFPPKGCSFFNNFFNKMLMKSKCYFEREEASSMMNKGHSINF